jgi:hypothetical protein
MSLLIFILGAIFSHPVEAFVLLNPKFELHDARSAKVKISSEGCRSNGVSDAKLRSAIKWAVEFWNDVPESRLKLAYGGTSKASLSDSRVPKNEIIIGCGSLPNNNLLGATQNDRDNGSARVTMNEDVFTGNYNENSFVGTLTHEVGHGLGLYHSNDPASVMTYRNHGWEDRPKYISQDDMDGVIYLYPNEKSAGGFLGSCSSYAAGNASGFGFLTEAVLSFLAVMGISIFIKAVLNRSNVRRARQGR